MKSELGTLRERADHLDPGEEALAAYEEILQLDPDDVGAANMIGRSLEKLGRVDEARIHWELVTELQPGNQIARQRLKNLAHLPRRPSARRAESDWPRRPPAEIVEPNFPKDGPARDACMRFLALTIRATESIDSERLAVTDRPSDGRFRVSGGKASGSNPWHEYFCVFVHEPSMSPALKTAIAEAGGTVENPPGSLKSLPESAQYAIPMQEFARFSSDLEKPHREHLLRSIAAGPAPWGHRHDPALREYIIEQAT